MQIYARDEVRVLQNVKNQGITIENLSFQDILCKKKKKRHLFVLGFFFWLGYFAWFSFPKLVPHIGHRGHFSNKLERLSIGGL